MYVRLLFGVLCLLGTAAVADASPYAYVANYNGNSVTVIDTNNNSKTGDIPLPNAQNPYGVAVNVFGSRVYVSSTSGNYVSVIDTSGNVVSSINIGLKSSGLAVNPAGTRLYVANPNDGKVTVVDTISGTVIKTANVGASPKGVAVSPAGDKVYVANSAAGNISVLNATGDSMSPVTTISVDAGPMGIALNPAGTRLYVACSNSGTVDVVDTSSNGIVATVASVGLMPIGVAVKPDATKVYVTLAGEDSVAVISTPANTLDAGKISVGTTPMGISISPDGTKLLTANQLTANATVINPATKAVVATVAAGDTPQSVGNFVGPQLFSITLTPPSHGTIAPSDPVTVDPNTNIALAAANLNFNLAVTPESNYQTTSILVDGTPIAGPPYFVPNVTASHTVSGTFTRFARTIFVTKSGSGTVVSTNSDLPVINCGSTCSQTYPLSRSINLTATADPGWFFQGWGGQGCSGNGTCTVVTDGVGADMNGNYTIQAYFSQQLVAASFQAAYESIAPVGGTITCDPAYSTEPSNSFVADQAMSVIVTPATPTTTLSLPSGSTSQAFTVTAGTITIGGGGTFIIQ